MLKDAFRSGLACVRGSLPRHRALLALLALDMLTKSLAFLLLPSEEPTTIFGAPVLQLALNEWGVMGGVEGIGSVTENSAYTLLLAAGLLLQAGIILWLGRSSFGFGMRLLAGLVLFFVIATVAEMVARPLADVSINPALVVTSIRGATLILSVSLYAASSAPLPLLAFTFLAAGALGNALSYLYPPFEVVDFLRIPLPGRDDVYGVINLADLYVLAFAIVALSWPLLAVIAALRPRRAPAAAHT